MTPRTRWSALIAIGLLCVGLAWLGPAWRRIGAAEADRAELGAIASVGMPPAPALFAPREAWRARDRAAAEARLTAMLRDAAGGAGLLIEAIGDGPARDPSLAMRRISVSGSEAQIWRFAEAIENRQPLVRFSRWRISPIQAGRGAIRLDADAAIVWSAQR